MPASETFEAIWTREGHTVPDAPPDQTIRPDTPPPGPFSSLPHLALGAANADESQAPDLHLHSELGAGGMGVVWLARQRSLDRFVAIKRVRDDAPAHADEALLREGRYMGSLEHPNIVPVHALGVDGDGRPLLVMKRIEGVEWRSLIRDHYHPFWDDEPGEPLVRHLEILIAVCNAIEYAHSRGVIHRDLKPENVMIGEFGEIYVADWGIAMRRDDPRRGIVGTPSYMAPEMVDPHAPIGPWTDVYLLGACLHEVLTLRTRHRGKNGPQVIRAAYDSVPYEFEADVPAELAAICNRACARNPAARFQSAADLQRALAAYLQHRGAQRVAESAIARLDALREAIATGVDRKAIEEAFIECRFGFKQALELQPESNIARSGLQNLIFSIVPYKLHGGDIDGASSLVDQLDADGTDVQSLRVQVDSARAVAARMRDIAADQDLTVGSRNRAVGFIAAILLFSGISLYVLHHTGSRVDAYDYGTSTLMSAISAALMTAGILAGREYTLVNSVNRSISLLALAMPYTVLVNQLVAWRFGVPLTAMLASDLVIIALGTATAWMIRPSLALAALPALVGVALIALDPPAALLIFALSSVAVVAAFGTLAWRAGREPAS